MSETKNVIQEIKNLMTKFGFLKEDEQPILLSFKTDNDVIVQTESLLIGNKIFKVEEDGSTNPLETGSYVIVDEKQFNVEVNDLAEIISVAEIVYFVKTMDGGELVVSGTDLVEGAKVTVVTDAGEVPAPDGEYELEDGTKLVIKDGAIESVQSPEEEPEVEVEVEEPVNSMSEMMELLKKCLTLMEEQMSKIEEKMDKMESELNSFKSEFQSFKSEPASKPIADGKTDFKEEKDDVLGNKINTILNMRKNNK